MQAVIDLLELARIAGSSEALNHLSDCYYFRLGVEQDFGKAFGCFSKAAKGNAKVGGCFMHGYSVVRNERKASEYAQKAAAGGGLHALEYLAHFYRRGFGTERKITKAVALLEKEGWAANLPLGETYLKGKVLK